MPRAYSMDLRERVLAACDAGQASRVVARQYRVSRAWVDRLKQRRQETGEIGPRRARRFKPQALAGHMEQLRALVAAQPDLTLAEIRHALGVPCSLVSVWRALRRLGLTLKKSPVRPRTDPTGCAPRAPALAGSSAQPGRLAVGLH